MRTTKIWNITLPPKMASEAEKIALEESRTKSELIREALRSYLWEKKWNMLRYKCEKEAKKQGIKEENIDKMIHEYRNEK